MVSISQSRWSIPSVAKIKILSSVPSFLSKNLLPEGVFNQSPERSTSARLFGRTGNLEFKTKTTGNFTKNQCQYNNTSLYKFFNLAYLLLRLRYIEDLKEGKVGILEATSEQSG